VPGGKWLYPHWSPTGQAWRFQSLRKPGQTVTSELMPPAAGAPPPPFAEEGRWARFHCNLDCGSAQLARAPVRVAKRTRFPTRPALWRTTVPGEVLSAQNFERWKVPRVSASALVPGGRGYSGVPSVP